ncbi:amidohydrolase family protein [Nocardia transvalensis]|uniref:amidohydrolase family protein n=1 Tax=Nocardia transvalensis TaxID=37333 RepID=UPI001895F3F8|nr:amidohydrolase family protein [Nocardia transvalensis]MBF6331268.1 amidohydrolase [Nocardia transvalensis]
MTVNGDDISYTTGFRERLGLPALIDVHTHFMPDQVMRKVWAYFDAAGPLTRRAWPITYRDEEQVRLKTLRSFGVRAFTSLVYPHRPDMAAWLNEWAADFAARTPDCLHTATFYPEHGADSYVEAAIEAGARVFKVHIQVGDFHPGDPLLTPVWGMLSDAGIPAIVHCGSGPVPGQFTGPQPISSLLQRFPRLRLIIAHLGAPEYSEFLDLADRYHGVHLDTTMNFTDFFESADPFPDTELPHLRDLGDRILFGSDFPNIPYTYPHALHALERLDLGDDWLRKVCHHNASRLFDLGSGPHTSGVAPDGSGPGDRVE